MIIQGTHLHGMKGARRSFKRQKKLLSTLGLPDVKSFFDGTINIDTSPVNYEIIKFDYFYENIKHKVFPRKRIEDFGFISITELRHRGEKYINWGYIYFPHNSPHFKRSHIFELIGPEIPDLKDNDIFELKVKNGRMKEA